MKLTIELNENEMKSYADSVCAFVGTIAGNRAPQVPTAAVQQPVTQVQVVQHHQQWERPTPMQQPVTQSDDNEAGAPDANAPAVDTTGMPWDERIHSPNKTRIANGSWRKKKGVAETVVAAVEAERRGAPQVTTAAVQQQQPAPDQFAQFAQQQQVVQQQVVQQQPMQQPAPDQFAQFAQQQVVQQQVVQQQPMQQVVQQQPMTAAEAHTQHQMMYQQPAQQVMPQTFPEFMRVIATGVNTGKIDPAYITSLCQRNNINAITDLGANPALIPMAYNMLVADGRA